MRVIVLVKATPESEKGVLPSTDLMEAMGKYNQQLVDAGVMLAGEGLHPSVKGKRVKFQGAQRTVTSGPFSGTSDLVSGFWLWEVKSMDDAVEWLKRAPFDGNTEIELRPVFSPEDFGDKATPELRAQKERQRAVSDRNRGKP